MLKYNIIRPATTRVLTTLVSKKSLKVMAINIAKQVKAKQKEFISPEFVFFSRNKSDLDISILILAWWQKLAYWKLMLKYFDNSVEKSANDNLLNDNFSGDDLLDGNSLAHINSNIDMNIKAKSNSDKDMIGSNFLEENSGINIFFYSYLISIYNYIVMTDLLHIFSSYKRQVKEHFLFSISALFCCLYCFLIS